MSRHPSHRNHEHSEPARRVTPGDMLVDPSTGRDTRAAQSNGDMHATVVSNQMDVALSFDVLKGANLKSPRFTTPGPSTRHFDSKDYEITTGIGPDLFQSSRDAANAMLDLLAARHGLSRVEAYMLCTGCGDLRISETVDLPNWIVSFYFPRLALE